MPVKGDVLHDRCIIEGCPEGGRYKRGMCGVHYQRWVATGDPGAPERQIARPRTPAPVGKRFGSWTVLAEAPTRTYGDAQSKSGTQRVRYWLVRCDCGTEGERHAQNIQAGKSKSCGCKAQDGRRIPLIVGERYGQLTVIAEGEPNARGHRRWACRCDCGTIVVVGMWDLRRPDNRQSRTCGCSRFRHGLADHPLYQTWTLMLDRCFNPASSSYYNYGGASPPVIVCDRWADRTTGIAAFVADMSPRPSPAHSLERRNPRGPYSPENCTWATRKEQRANQRKLPRVRIDLLRQAAKEVGIGAADLDAALALIAQWAPALEVAQSITRS